MFNKFTLNPAVAGSEKYLEASSWHRSQWTGFEGAPISQYLAVQSSFFKKKSGLGGYIFNDIAGPIKNTGINASYAYHLPLSREITFSMGLGFNFSRYVVDGNMMEIYHADDPLLDLNKSSVSMMPEASAGGYLYHKDFYFGFSGLNIINNKTPVFTELGTKSSMPRSTHFNIIGAYRFELDKNVYAIPSFYINKVVNNPFQLDVNIRIDYKNFIETGFTYRSQDALALLFGVRFLKDFLLSYSYDLQYSKLQKNTNGSHEIMIRYQFFYNEVYKKMYQRETNSN
jgi:type IX secretion system PorP/SprF family membrane protein